MRANVMRRSLFEVFWMDCLAHDCTLFFVFNCLLPDWVRLRSWNTDIPHTSYCMHAAGGPPQKEG